jgi:hypothetical protein
VAGCLDPATEVDDAKDWCRAHLETKRAAMFRFWLAGARRASGFSYVALGLALLAAAAWAFLPSDGNYGREVLAGLFTLLPLLFLLARRGSRRHAERQLEALKEAQRDAGSAPDLKA